MASFEDLGLPAEIVRAVVGLGYGEPTAIQQAAIPALLEGRDVMAQARTGTGKTAAFALPMIARMEAGRAGIQGLVLAPTRELATQVARAITRYGEHRGVAAIPIYGGQSYAWQEKRLLSGAQIVVGTPGRTLDLINRGKLKLEGVRTVALDEADEMLKMGFIDDVEAILAATPAEERQTAIFSATLPEPIRRLAEKYTKRPWQIGQAKGPVTVEGVEQRFHLVQPDSKLAALTRLLEVEDVERALIFARTRVGVAALGEALVSRGFQAEALHGDLPQLAREAVLARFRRGYIKLLVATDVAARGLDIPDVSHVFNYDFPDKPEEYVHRIGRTARAGRAGVAISLVIPREERRIAEVGFFTKSAILRAVVPSAAEVHAVRDERFARRIRETIAAVDLGDARRQVAVLESGGLDLATIAAAALHLARAGETERPDEEVREVFARSERKKPAPPAKERAGRKGRKEVGMVRLSVDVGKANGVRPADVVATVAREAGVPGTSIGAISVLRYKTTFDVAEDVAERVLRRTRKGITLRGREARIRREGGT